MYSEPQLSGNLKFGAHADLPPNAYIGGYRALRGDFGWERAVACL